MMADRYGTHRLIVASTRASLEDGTELIVCHPMTDVGMWNRFGPQLLFRQVALLDQYGVKGRLQRGDVVLDVGASIGAFTWIAATQGARVYAFEPNPKDHASLVQFITLNHLSAEPIQVALGESEGVARFNCGYETTLGDGQILTDDMEVRHVPVEEGGDEDAIEVDVTTIDAFVRQRNLSSVRLVKVDTEGYEARVVRGAADTIRRLQPILLLSSYHRTGDEEALSSLISEIDPSYRCIRHFVDLPDTESILACLPPSFDGGW